MYNCVSNSLNSKFSEWFIAFAIFSTALIAATSSHAIGEMFVKIDEAHIVRLDSAVSQIILGNPSVADVSVQSSKMLVVTGKSFGFTNLIVLDKHDNEILNQRVSVRKDHTQMVTVYKGASHYSLHCTPVCEQPLVIGDNPVHFDAVNKAMGTKFSMSNGQSKQSAAQ